MEKIKRTIKKALGYIRCKRARIFYNGDIYIGRATNIKGGRNIVLNKGVCIRPEVDMWCGATAVIEIGKGTEIGERSRISIAHSLRIGEKVLLSPNVYITDCDHRYDEVGIPVIEQGVIKNENQVEIKKHAYIGINSVIIGNVSIGMGAVIGANSVVTKDIPDYCVAVGSPCKVIKKYNVREGKWERVR